MSVEFNPAGRLLAKLQRTLTTPPQAARLPDWPVLDACFGGLRSGELTCLSAPTGAGKTTLIAGIAYQLWKQNVPTFVAPVETGDVDFLARVLSVAEGRDFNDGEAHSPAAVDALIDKYRADLERAPLFIATYDSKVSTEDLRDMLNYQKQKHGVRVALLDNLNYFLDISNSSEQILEIDRAVRVFKDVAVSNDMHVLLICHPRKQDGKDDRILSENDLKGSGTIAQEAFNVILWNRPGADESPDETKRVLLVRKMRKRGLNVNKRFVFDYRGGRYEEDRGTTFRISPWVEKIYAKYTKRG
jgi:replicative DNA helicase